MDNHFTIIIGSYNNFQWVENNIGSITSQDYPFYKVLYFDDASEDGTSNKVRSMIKSSDTRFEIYDLYKERKYKTWFFAHIEPDSDNDILVFLDGDDMFSSENVLSYLNSVYNQTNCWMTYGGMAVWNGGENITEAFPQNSEAPPEVIRDRSYRKDLWRYSHLKTMRAFLWNRFNKADLKPEGKFEPCQDDLAIMFAALEMCPSEKIYRVKDPIYLYNNCQSRGCTELKDKSHLETIIRNIPKYEIAPVISPTLAGGLGNQMFEVAVAASMAKDHNAVLLINPNEHILPNQGRNVNNYLDNVFARVATDAAPPVKVGYHWDHIYYKPVPYQPNLKLMGHYQSFKYFEHNSDYIKRLFAPTTRVRDYINDKYGITNLANFTAIQVRRGDYVKFPDHHPMLPPEFTTKAVKLVNPEKAMVFSDDPKWCQENLHFDCPTEYVKEEDYIELYLMTFCKNLIISNSSFGWWGAYLNQAEGYKVICPPFWFGRAIISDGFQMDDLVPSSWIRLQYE
jgi:glycosyltransferase involved in cell wall biosynthesis